jgi:hypothetical protein
MITVSCRTTVIFIRKTDAPEFNRVMPLTGYHPQKLMRLSSIDLFDLQHSQLNTNLTRLQVDPSVSELRRGTPGKLVLFQRHGQASKNKVLRPVRLAYEQQLEQLLDHDPHLSGEGATAKADAALAAWRTAANAPQWFDDGLNAAGVAEAAAAGLAVGQFLADVGRAPDLLVTSPFRRAWQTQLIGYGTANFPGVPGCGEAPAWVASDDLSETPYSEAPCRRHPKDVLARWQPCLNVDSIADECTVGPETNLDFMWKAMCEEAKQRRGQANKRPKLDGETKVEANVEAKVEAKVELDEELLDNPAQV